MKKKKEKKKKSEKKKKKKKRKKKEEEREERTRPRRLTQMIRTGSNLYSVLENKRYSSRNMSFTYRLTTKQNGEHRYLSIFTSDRSNQTKSFCCFCFVVLLW